MTVYQLTVQTLAPLHIGDGDELRQDFDFAVHEGRTYRLDEDAILRAKETLLRPGRDGSYPPPGRLLNADAGDFDNRRLFRYILPGFPRSAKVDARLKSCIKDVFDRPYIPGSSLKGALRTALAWNGWTEVRPRLDREAIGRNRSWAGQPLERKLFGPDPNHDLLRALHVADLSGPQKAGQGLMLVNAQVLTLHSAGSPIELEAIAGDQAFHGSLTVDDRLFEAWAEKELHFANRKHWLDGKELAARVQAHSQARIKELAAWYERADGCDGIARFYRQLAGVQPAPYQALLQFGWGAGWDGKTFWTHLRSDPLLFEQLVKDFRMHKAAPGSPPRKPGDPFPRSRRAAMVVRERIPRPAAPFGWVLLELAKA